MMPPVSAEEIMMTVLNPARADRRANSAARDAVYAAMQPLTGASHDYDTLLDKIGDARFVLIGEASHGTHEFYNERARITRRLLEEKGFHAVAVEADWPDAYRVNRFLRGHGQGDDPLRSLSDFTRFPLWMWRNAVVLRFITDLAEYNATVPDDRTVGFYGLDLYSLYGSIAAVVAYLEKVDPDAARRARDRYGCLEFFEPNPQRYGMETSFGIREPCADEAVAQLVELMRRAGEYTEHDGPVAGDEYFFAEQNARLVVNAEMYYRAMFHAGRDSTWNLRDTHMADTLDALEQHLTQRHGEPAKIVVWAHNSHLGDARATDMGEERGELNLGQLTRERHGREAFLIGFSTYTGTVTAAQDWDGPAQRKRVRPGMAGSVEELMHEAGEGRDFWLDLRDDARLREALKTPRLERAIGVLYRPQTERWSHYFHCRVAEQFDALLHFDETSALQPLDRTPGWQEGELPDTYPTGM
jgi:erythromycin esterase-like protein